MICYIIQTYGDAKHIINTEKLIIFLLIEEREKDEKVSITFQNLQVKIPDTNNGHLVQ